MTAEQTQELQGLQFVVENFENQNQNQVSIEENIIKRLSDNEILEKVKEIKNKQAYISLINKEIDVLKEDIKQELISRGIENLEVDIFKVLYMTISSSKFDNKKFKKEHEDLYNSYCYTTETKRFDIK